MGFRHASRSAVALSNLPYAQPTQVTELSLSPFKRLRLEKGWTQDELSRKLGVTPKTISFYELGERRPSRNSLIKLAQIFGITIDELVNEDAEILEHKMPSRESDLARDVKKY